MFTVFTPFFTLGPGSTTLYSSHTLCHGLISSTTFLQHSTTLYSLQLYSSSTVYNLYNIPLHTADAQRSDTNFHRIFYASCDNEQPDLR